MLSPAQEQIKRITGKVETLLDKMQQLKEENERLKADLAKRAEAEQALMEKSRQMEEQVNELKANPGQMDDASRKAFEKQLNHYIREIDRCIALLGQ